MPVGQFYHDFLPTSDHDVEDLLVAAAERLQAGPRVSAVPPRDREVLIPTEQGQLPGRLVVPAGARAGLGLVTAPTLLVVGGHDPRVLELNRRAAAMLRCKNRLSVVRGATHLFEEPGTLQAVAELAAWWFVDHLVVHSASSRVGTSQ